MLTQQLRELERDGLLHRHVLAEVPPRVEYTLTELGMSLLPVLKAIGAWGRQLKERKLVKSVGAI